MEKHKKTDEARLVNIYILSSAAWPNENKSIPYLVEPFKAI